MVLRTQSSLGSRWEAWEVLGRGGDVNQPPFSQGPLVGVTQRMELRGQGRVRGTSELATAPVQAKGAGAIGWERRGEASVWALIWGREHLSAASDEVGGRGTASSLMDYGFLMVASSQLASPATVVSFHALLPTPPCGQLLLVGAGTEVGGGAQQQGHRRGCASLGRGSHFISLSAALPTIKPECLVLMASWGCRESTSLACDPFPSPHACPPFLLQAALCLKLGLQPPPRAGREGGCDVLMPVSKMNVAFNAPSFSPYPWNLLDKPHGADGFEAWASASEFCWSGLLGSVLHTALVGLLIQSGRLPSLQATALVALPIDCGFAHSSCGFAQSCGFAHRLIHSGAA